MAQLKRGRVDSLVMHIRWVIGENIICYTILRKNILKINKTIAILISETLHTNLAIVGVIIIL